MSTDLIIERRARDLGGGFMVGRVLPFAKQRMVGPFIFFDHMGPMDMAAGITRDFDVKPHPHIGLSTVTYLYDGSLTHRDSLGFTQEIKPGEVNWMVAGSGITHSERFDYARAHGAHMHGVQAWVALPDEHEETDPAFYHYEGQAQLPEWEEDGVKVRLIAGTAEGLHAQVVTHSPLFYLHWTMQAGGSRSIAADYSERAVYVVQGHIEVDGHALTVGQMAVLSAGKSVQLRAREPSIVMILGGEPIGERYISWNFVSSSKDRLEQARADWQAQRMKLPDGDNQESVPFPAGVGG